jgi:hypothetical protein
VNPLAVDPLSRCQLEQIATLFCKLPPRFLFEYLVLISNPVGLTVMLDLANDFQDDWPPDTIQILGADRFPPRLQLVPR